MNSSVCRMLHASLHSVFSQLTDSKYHTVSTGLQASCKPAKVEYFIPLNGPIVFWRCGYTSCAWLEWPVVVEWWGPMWYLFLEPKIPGGAPHHWSVTTGIVATGNSRELEVNETIIHSLLPQFIFSPFQLCALSRHKHFCLPFFFFFCFFTTTVCLPRAMHSQSQISNIFMRTTGSIWIWKR